MCTLQLVVIPYWFKLPGMLDFVISRGWERERVVETSGRLSASVIHRIHHECSIFHWLIADVCFVAEKIDAFILENFVKDKRNGGTLSLRNHARRTKLHLYPNVQSHKTFNAIQIPCVDVNIVYR